ncbi:hypothetical protein P0082_11295 [Candidatus Haliotispira prima]|uniref:Uncharacterized protein n=1 Tax=Candidatus Haliotispira prima TaxID=3034016 RepID=A0ABY8MGC2_9SPIO|nr:hypothetical protein P0082_11295 [Candidatus Haliotispira prima]
MKRKHDKQKLAGWLARMTRNMQKSCPFGVLCGILSLALLPGFFAPELPGQEPDTPQTVVPNETDSANSTSKYKIVDIYILGNDKIGAEYILRYLRENGIHNDTRRSKRELEKAALRLANIADTDATLLGLELIYDYVEDPEQGPIVYVEVLVAEMSISFIPGGGNAYARFGWANRIERNGRPSLIWLAAGYNRQDLILHLPYLWGAPFSASLEFGHHILDQWDFNESSRIRSNAFIIPKFYLQPLTWLKLGVGLDAGLLYFYKGQSPSSIEIGNRLGLGPELNGKDVPGTLHGRLAVLSSFELNRKYLARKGLGYHFRLSGRHEVAGLFAGNHAFSGVAGLVTEPLPWFRPSLDFRGDWRSEGMLPLASEVFSSRYEGYIRATGELRFSFSPIHIKDPIAINIGWSLGAITGFANASQNFTDIDLERDLELSLFIGPDIYWGMPVNIRTRLDFGVIFRKQFRETGFAINVHVF